MRMDRIDELRWGIVAVRRGAYESQGEMVDQERGGRARTDRAMLVGYVRRLTYAG